MNSKEFSMKVYFFIFLFIVTNPLFSQNIIIKGNISDGRHPVFDCNIYIKNTLIGTTSDENGDFDLIVKNVNDTLKLVFSYMGYKEHHINGVAKFLAKKKHKIVLKEDNILDDVLIFSEKKVRAGYISGLSAIDIITTPSAMGDAMTGISTSLPGNQIDPNDGRFFVRGGDYYETKVFINDMNVHSPFTSNGPNLPNRGRFSPFLFDGISFSAGGFEAEYGRALSSVLLMNTKSKIIKDETQISIKSVGVDAGITKILSEKLSLTATVDYTHLGPYRSIFPSRYKWNEDYNTLAGEISSVFNLPNGTIKSYNRYDQTRLDYTRFDLGFGTDIDTKIYEKNFYSNNSMNLKLGKKFKFYSGIVYSFNERDVYGVFTPVDYTFVKDNLLHIKTKVENKFFDAKLITKVGVEYFNNKYYSDYKDEYADNFFIGDVNNNIFSSFIDIDYKISSKLLLKTGLRTDYSISIKESIVSPRIRLNYEPFSNFTASPYYGNYNQTPQNGVLIFDLENNLKSERADQYGLNLFWKKDKRIVYIDAYKKEYKDLVKFTFAPSSSRPVNLSNSGKGYANGLDVFFWDKKTFKDIEYRISYTYIDAKRDYQNYPGISFPNFYSRHNASFVTKYWINKIRSLISLNYVYSSGNPYTNPNIEGFNNSFTKSYNSLSLSYSFLFSDNLFIYSSISNILNFKNVASYDYSSTPNDNGVFEEQVILPSSDHFFFIGLFYRFGGVKSNKDKMKQINN